MGKRQFAGAATPPVGASELQAQEGSEAQGSSDKKTSSDVQGSGRFFFALAKILVDVIDDELQVSDAHKCAGKKVDKVKRVGRVAANVVSKASVAQAKLGSVVCITNLFDRSNCYF